jgi:endoglucanase
MQKTGMNRREFVQLAGGATAGLALSGVTAEKAPAKVTAASLPRWRGFNLLEKFTAGRSAPFVERDFAWMRAWGFDFVRLPMSYQCWADPNDWLKLREEILKHVDEAVEFGRRYGIHVNLNFHRAPGYCVNPPKEPLDLWTDEKALEACALHWAQFAQRYRGIPNERLSFDLLNEPPDIPEAAYARVVKRLVEAIRAKDSNRLVIADGLRWGTRPVLSLVELGVAQSTRGYNPMRISHYRASWVRGSDQWPEPDWPLKVSEQETWDRERLRRENIEPWKQLQAKGVGIHVGECGAFSQTPHRAVLAWLRDCLELWQEQGWGWALWNLRGSFGIVDSNRKDVHYEDFEGHKLDRQLLELLQAH